MPKVVVGIIIKRESKTISAQSDERLILLCQRLKNARYALKWEFPGGKVEPGESSEQALVREINEELKIEIKSFAPYFRQENGYPDGETFDVSYYVIDQFSGEIQNNAFADMKWVYMSELDQYDILQGNCEVVQKLKMDYAKA